MAKNVKSAVPGSLSGYFAQPLIVAMEGLLDEAQAGNNLIDTSFR